MLLGHCLYTIVLGCLLFASTGLAQGDKAVKEDADSRRRRRKERERLLAMRVLRDGASDSCDFLRQPLEVVRGHLCGG